MDFATAPLYSFLTNHGDDNMFTIRVHSNGQASIHTDTIAIYRATEHLGTYGTSHIIYKNDGVMVMPATANRTEARDIVKAMCPEACTRIVKHGVMVRFPAELVAIVKQMDAEWQRMALAGMSHREMQLAAINSDSFRALAA